MPPLPPFLLNPLIGPDDNAEVAEFAMRLRGGAPCVCVCVFVLMGALRCRADEVHQLLCVRMRACI